MDDPWEYGQAGGSPAASDRAAPICSLQIGVVQFQCALAAALALGEKVPSRFGILVQLFVDRWWVSVYFVLFYFYFYIFTFLFLFAFLLFYFIRFKCHPFSVGAS